MRGTTRGVIVTIGAVVLAVGAVPGTASAQPSSTAGLSAALGATHDVIVVLRDQHGSLGSGRSANSPRAAAIRADEAVVIGRARSNGVLKIRGFAHINAFAATVTAAQATALAADPEVAAVYPDLPIKAVPVVREQAVVGRNAPQNPTSTTSICPSDPSKPQLEPEALEVTNTAFANAATPQAQSIVNGSGVKVAFIADGLDVNNPGFIRADGSHVFVDYQDFSGDGLNAVTGGAEAFGDASAIAAQGLSVYDLSNFVNPAHPLPPGCNITIRGVAPGASLIGLKVFGNSDFAPTSHFIDAIEYAITSGADVLNESFGANPYPDTGNDPISLADQQAVAAGVTVVASTGDAGTNGTIGSPADRDGVIGVAATTTFRSYLQETRGGAQLGNGTFASNNISALSSGGVTQSGRVPDLAAPGDLGWALCTPNTSLYTNCTSDAGSPSPIQNFGGTSQSSPLTAGAAALVIQAYASTHGGARPSPALVKQILTSTATDLGHPAFEQGAGLLNTLEAVKAARAFTGFNQPTNALVPDQTQVALNGNPKVSLSQTITITNFSDSSQTVSATTRSFEQVVSSVDDSVTLNSATAPAYIDFNGVGRSFVSKQFTVGTADRLDVSLAAPTGNGLLRVTLLDPNGRLTAYSLPQGVAHFAHVDVHAPVPGQWTAVFAISTSSGFNGSIAYRVVQTNLTAHGTIKPASQTIASGASATFTLKTKMPATPGDLSTSVQFAGSNGGTLSVPVTLRAVMRASRKGFPGVITGGNGRATGGTAQSNIYYANVPRKKKVLGIGFTFTDPGQTILATLMGPDGQTYSFQSNQPNADALQIYRRNPAEGQWVVSLNITNPVTGLEVSQPFTGFLSYTPPRIKARLPHSTRTKLAAGTPLTIPVKITNTGVQPLTYTVDSRLNTTTFYELVDLSGNGGVTPLPQTNVTPFFLVPTESTELQALVLANQPINLDFFYQSGNPDLYAPYLGGNQALVVLNAPEVSSGLWIGNVGQLGPFGPSGAPSGTAQVRSGVFTQTFDGDTTTPDGNFWTAGLSTSSPDQAAQFLAIRQAYGAEGAGAGAGNDEAVAADSSTPLTLNPGETGTIDVTITPSGPVGSTVQGTMYVDTIDGFTAAGSELVALPYAYTIK